MRAPMDTTKRSTSSTLTGEGVGSQSPTNGTDAYDPSWGAVRREASPSARSRGGVLQRVNRNGKESPGPRSVSGRCVFAAFFSALQPSGPFSLALIHEVRGSMEFSEVGAQEGAWRRSV